MLVVDRPKAYEPGGRQRVRGFGGPGDQLMWQGPVADPDVFD